MFRIFIGSVPTMSLLLVTLLASAAPPQAKKNQTADSADSSSQSIILQPSDDPHPEPVVIGSSRSGSTSNEMVDFRLTSHTGETITKESLLGTPWVANFIFADCPTHCPMTLKETYDLYRRLEDTDVRFVTITVNPKQDTVERLAQLADVFGADGKKWMFLTGDPAELAKVIRQGFREPMASTPMMLAHSLNMMQVDAEGHVVGRYRFKYQHPEGKDEINILRLVLEGKMDIPEDNRFRPREETSSSPRRVAPIAAQQSAAADRPAEPESMDVPRWVDRLRTTNALLNGLATILLLSGLIAIKRQRQELHKRFMLFAFGVSVAFLVCYLTYHGALKHYTGIGHKPYAGSPAWHGSYRAILGTHVVLAAIVPVLAIMTILRGLKQQWERHRKIAKITFPIWLYVSVTGVIIYFMNAV